LNTKDIKANHTSTIPQNYSLMKSLAGNLIMALNLALMALMIHIVRKN